MTYLSWPMRVGPDGRIRTARTAEEVWSDRLSMLVCARMGERVMRGDYGTQVTNALFENGIDDPESAIRNAVSKWIPALVVEKVDVSQSEAAYRVVVTFTTPEGKSLTNEVSIAVPGEGGS